MTIQSYISDDLLVEGLFGALSWYIYWKILSENRAGPLGTLLSTM